MLTYIQIRAIEYTENFGKPFRWIMMDDWKWDFSGHIFSKDKNGVRLPDGHLARIMRGVV